MITGGVLDAKEKGVPGDRDGTGIGKSRLKPGACTRLSGRRPCRIAAGCPRGTGKRCGYDRARCKNGCRHDSPVQRKESAFLCTTLSPALPYALFDRSITNATEVEQFNGNVVFEGIIDCAKKAIANDIPVVLGNDVGCPWITQSTSGGTLLLHKLSASPTPSRFTATARASRNVAGIERKIDHPQVKLNPVVTAELDKFLVD
ncbi:MAG: hypothetical protein V8R97_11755 [Fusicatenibacter saccharivorans]